MQEWERELTGMKLREEDLGKTEKFAGKEVYTHISFVGRLLETAKQAKVDLGTNLIWQVCDNLPKFIRDLVPSSQTNWTTFADAIKAINAEQVREGVKKMREARKMKDNIENLQKLISANHRQPKPPDTPTTAIRMQLSRTTLSAPSQPPQALSQPARSQDTFCAAGGGRGNLFNTNRNSQPPKSPPTEADRAEVRRALAEWPMQPATTEGKWAWLEQCQAWIAKHGKRALVTQTTGFPVQPGGAPVGSGECYRCARTGHMARLCPGDVVVAAAEAHWRSICGSVLGHSGRATQVNAVAAPDDDDTLQAWLFGSTTTTNSGQGNNYRPSM